MDCLSALGPSILDRRFFGLNDKIALRNTPVHAIWLILRGTAVLTIGEKTTVSFDKSVGSIYGDVETILDLPYQGDLIVTSQDGLEAVCINPEKFKDAINRAPNFMQVYTKINALRVLKGARKVERDAALIEEMSARNNDIDQIQARIEELEQQISDQFYPSDYDPDNPPEALWQQSTE